VIGKLLFLAVTLFGFYFGKHPSASVSSWEQRFGFMVCGVEEARVEEKIRDVTLKKNVLVINAALTDQGDTSVIFEEYFSSFFVKPVIEHDNNIVFSRHEPVVGQLKIIRFQRNIFVISPILQNKIKVEIEPAWRCLARVYESNTQTTHSQKRVRDRLVQNSLTVALSAFYITYETLFGGDIRNQFSFTEGLSNGKSVECGFGRSPSLSVHFVGGVSSSSSMVKGSDNCDQRNKGQRHGGEISPKHQLSPKSHVFLSIQVALSAIILCFAFALAHGSLKLGDAGLDAIERRSYSIGWLRLILGGSAALGIVGVGAFGFSLIWRSCLLC